MHNSKSSNPQGNKEINQKRGPVTGNAGTMTKRDTYVAEKTASSGEKSKLALMVTSALEMRGRGTAPKINPALEGVSSNTNTGPKKNTTADGSGLSASRKK